MFMLRYTLLVMTLALSLSPAVLAAPLRNETGQVVKQVNPRQFFVPDAAWPKDLKVETDPAKLAEVARTTLAYIEAYPDDSDAVHAGLFQELGISLEDVRRTLRRLDEIVSDDLQAGRPSRLQDLKFLQQHFRLVRWNADQTGAKAQKVNVPDNRIRLTKYVVFEAQGKEQKQGEYNCALYALPPDEADLTQEAADARKDTLIRYRFDKQQVVAGALDKLGVKPMVWLNRQGLEDALMQGSVMVVMPNGQRRMFNVHRNNGIGYDRRIKEPRLQKRYWYFKEVNGIQGYGRDQKIAIQPGVTFAGDVYNFGLGKLVGINYSLPGKSVLRLGLIADTGGAFVPNLYQLDFLAGVYPDRASFQRGIAALPEYAQAYFLIAR
jgi:hypothetical protein